MGKGGATNTRTYGNLALDTLDERVVYRSIKGGRKEKEKAERIRARQLNVAYIVFLSVVSALMVLIFMGYINAKTEYTLAMRHKNALAAEYNAMKHENNISYHDKMASVDYTKIKEIAMNELGMRYPVKAQIVPYEPVKTDSVVQYREIPEEVEKCRATS